MAENSMKTRLIYLQKLFEEETDDRHHVTTPEILKYLKAHGVSTDRKTLRTDINLLIEYGMDIVIIRSKPNRYFLGERVFEMPELKLLIDAVHSSRFITKKKSRILVKKLSGLASKYQKKTLGRHIFTESKVKPSNEKIYYAVDAINEAINNGRQISFKYLEYTPSKELFFRGNGEVYELSPYALYWNDDFYYVVGWSEKHGNVSSFRVDRLSGTEEIDKDAVPPPEGFDMEKYSKQIFEMFSGEPATVELECDNNLMKYVIDQFGEEVETRIVSPERFAAKVEVELSPTFYAWVFQFGGGIKILTPEKAVREISEMAEKMISRA